jgi:hypothetical protein
MNATPSKLISPADLPESLWRPQEGVACLPPDLVDVWKTLLDRHGLRVLAEQPRPDKGPVGGLSTEAIDQHLAWSFTGSSARVELAMLDPKSNMPHVADAFALVFSGGRVALADLPCGSGAAVLTIVTAVAELRRKARVPREPLHVILVAGEISERARDYAAEAIDAVRSSLEAQAIWIEPAFLRWDVCDALSNTDLIRELTVRSQSCGARMLVMANFSGFLQREGKLSDAQPQLEEIFRHSRDKRSSVIWIEPQTNIVTHQQGGLFNRLGQWLARAWARFVRTVRPEDKSSSEAKAEASIVDALNSQGRFDAHLAVMRFDLRLER